MNDLKSQVNDALKQASEAFKTYKNLPGKQKAAFLRLVGEEMQNLGDKLIKTVIAESNLPEGRVRSELGRTVGQLNKFADLVEEGSWREATIDLGDATRQPLPKPDLRKILVPLGPVVVFGAGNFPLAFSTAGGDTASALAGGNPVVVKGHPAHPETGKLVAGAIQKAIQKSGLHPGVFSHIQDSGYEAGRLLVQHPAAKAVTFTGSLQGGLTLAKLAAERDEPIPVFAEMGSINPVVVLPGALEKNATSIASKLVASVNLGAGQFCTNPGLIITAKTEGFNAFIHELASQVKAAAGSRMFSNSVLRNYKLNASKVFSFSEVRLVAKGEENTTEVVFPAIATVSATDFLQNPMLHEEVFGPFSLLVDCEDLASVTEVVNSLKGQLTATLFATEEELAEQKELADNLLEKCGRLLFNGVPTGVEVCAAMQHGGPFPATTDSRFTSVGVGAIKRFVRPVSFQDFPEKLLPPELQNNNPLNIWRTVDNILTKDALTTTFKN